MKAERETIVVSDATTLFGACDKILKNIDMFPELDEALVFLHKMVVEYRVWLAYDKKHAFPLNFHQGFYTKRKIWTITFQDTTSTTKGE